MFVPFLVDGTQIIHSAALTGLTETCYPCGSNAIETVIYSASLASGKHEVVVRASGKTQVASAKAAGCLPRCVATAVCFLPHSIGALEVVFLEFNTVIPKSITSLLHFPSPRQILVVAESLIHVGGDHERSLKAIHVVDGARSASAGSMPFSSTSAFMWAVTDEVIFALALAVVSEAFDGLAVPAVWIHPAPFSFA